MDQDTQMLLPSESDYQVPPEMVALEIEESGHMRKLPWLIVIYYVVIGLVVLPFAAMVVVMSPMMLESYESKPLSFLVNIPMTMILLGAASLPFAFCGGAYLLLSSNPQAWLTRGRLGCALPWVSLLTLVGGVVLLMAGCPLWSMGCS
eukprot:TRINITY_DN5674_c0_g1_i1.p1 TRINITY_DN5674_c0_g1~~TRINITY_DN5674_c0_g1_i1.p1  ORF type:complete len:148 (+),score=18.11 TRINITY_DN5674_c0_g1_i1:303-746(+)